MSNDPLTKAQQECGSHLAEQQLLDAFHFVAESERRRIFAEAEKRAIWDDDGIGLVLYINDLKEICRIKNIGDRFTENGKEFEVVSEPSSDGRVYVSQICKVNENAEEKDE